MIGVTDSPGYALLLSEIGKLHEQMQDMCAAVHYFKEALQIYHAAGAHAATVAKLWARVGKGLESLEDMAQAADAYTQARGLFEACGEVNHAVYAEVVSNASRLESGAR